MSKQSLPPRVEEFFEDLYEQIRAGKLDKYAFLFLLRKNFKKLFSYLSR